MNRSCEKSEPYTFEKYERIVLYISQQCFYENFGANSIVHSQIRTSLKDEFVQNALFLRYNLQRAFPQMLFWGKKHEFFDEEI